METQRTLNKEATVRGRGLHTGVVTEVTVKPAPPNSGIVFVRVDQTPPLRIPATIEHICQNEGRQTALGNGKVQIRTIEHLMATFHGLGIDNAVVEITADELPGLDGSAQEFAEAVSKAGLAVQDAPREYLVVTEPVFIEQGNQSLIALPHPAGLKLSYTLSYNHRDLRDQFFAAEVSPDFFRSELAPARTFCLREEAEMLRAQGFGQGASLENTLVFENDRPIQNTLRFPNEACRHKMIDLLGDLYLIGRPLRAHVIACRTGHIHNLRLLQKLAQKARPQKVSVPSSNPIGPSSGPTELDVAQIQKIIPHRHPFLFVDKIIQMTPGVKAVGIKNVSADEPFFKGHFPGHPIMPGVLILEALAQVGGVLMLSEPQNRGKLAYFMTIENVKFRQAVYPGDELRLVAEAIRLKSRTGQCSGKAYVGEKLVCEAEVKFAIVDPA